MTKKLVLIFIWALLGGCATNATPTPNQTGSGNPPIPPTPSPTSSPVEPEPAGPQRIRLWVPPEFNPASGTEASQIFLSRLDEFAALYPDIRIEVRVKAAQGPGGMIDSLSTTQAVAPEGLPDLVAMPRPVLETAAARGLIFPFEELDAIPQDTDWYDFAQQLARVDNTIYGLPFACDALVLLYRSGPVGEPPRDWTTTKQLDTPILFAAGSPQSLFTFAMYQSAGGNYSGPDGNFRLTPGTLTAVYSFYKDAQTAGVFSSTFSQYLSEEDTFLAFQNRDADLAVTWISKYWTRGGSGTASSPLPTPGGVPFAPLTGWAWALSNPTSAQADLSTELAQFLTDSEYLADWTLAAGYLPPRPSVLAAWSETAKSALASRLVLSAQLIPPADLLNIAGPLLQQGLMEVLTNAQTPTQAAQTVVNRLESP